LDKKARPYLVAGGELPLGGDSLAVLARAVLRKGKPFRFEARGTSMLPSIRDGDIVTVSPLTGTGPKTGDIVAFVHPGTGRVRVHRVVKVRAGRYHLKGDNALGTDGALTRDAILGRVVRLERGGRVRRLGPSVQAAALAGLSRSVLVTRLARRTRRAFSRRGGRA
jgi:signal peptidase